MRSPPVTHILRFAHRTTILSRPSVLSCALHASRRLTHTPRRGYATQRDSGASSLLSQALDQKQRAAEQDLRESIGPIPLGMARPSLRQGERVKKWSELSTGGKAVRAAARTTNLTVILIGAGLTAVLGYALTSELFSSNSPTVLYGQACEKIKASPRLAKHLHAPLKFHNNPPSAVRPRHRNQHVSSQIAVDSAGREHMFLTFYIEGSTKQSSSIDPDAGYLDVARAKASALADMSWEEVQASAADRVKQVQDSAATALRYLVGKPIPTATQGASSQEKDESKEEPKGVWSVAGLFSGLRTSMKGGDGGKEAETQGWTEGEVHAELIRNDDGYFVFRYLVVDIPNSRTRNPIRVFVERAPGVSEYEPVIRRGSA